MKKQRNTLISYILFYGGFLLAITSIIFILCYTFCFDKHNGDYVHFILSILILLGITMPLFASNFNLYFYFGRYNPDYRLMKLLHFDETGFIQGVPNNCFKEYESLFNLYDGIVTLEYKDGLFIGRINENKILLNMKGWFFKNKYIFEMVQTSLRVNYINKNQLPSRYLYLRITDPNIKKFIIIIKKGNKQKKYIISTDGVIKSPIGLKIKNYKKIKFIDNNKKLSIRDLYDLNIK